MSKIQQIIFKSLLISLIFISTSKADLIKPDSKIEPFEVIKIQLNGLQKNDSTYKDSGFFNVKVWNNIYRSDCGFSFVLETHIYFNLIYLIHIIYFRN